MGEFTQVVRELEEVEGMNASSMKILTTLIMKNLAFEEYFFYCA